MGICDKNGLVYESQEEMLLLKDTFIQMQMRKWHQATSTLSILGVKIPTTSAAAVHK